MRKERDNRVAADRWKCRAPLIVATLFSVSGLVHLVRPVTFTPIVPKFLPAKTALVYGSGVAELVCAAGLWRRARWGGTAAAGLLVILWPANLQMAVDAQRGGASVTRVASWMRLPLQLPLIWCALQAQRDDRAGKGRGASTPAVDHSLP